MPLQSVVVVEINPARLAWRGDPPHPHLTPTQVLTRAAAPGTVGNAPVLSTKCVSQIKRAHVTRFDILAVQVYCPPLHLEYDLVEPNGLDTTFRSMFAVFDKGHDMDEACSWLSSWGSFSQGL